MLRALMEESRQTKTDGLPKPSESKQEPKRNIRNWKYLARDRIWACYAPPAPATWEVETEEEFEPRSLEQAWAIERDLLEKKSHQASVQKLRSEERMEFNILKCWKKKNNLKFCIQHRWLVDVEGKQDFQVGWGGAGPVGKIAGEN